MQKSWAEDSDSMSQQQQLHLSVVTNRGDTCALLFSQSAPSFCWTQHCLTQKELASMAEVRPLCLQSLLSKSCFP